MKSVAAAVSPAAAASPTTTIASAASPAALGDPAPATADNEGDAAAAVANVAAAAAADDSTAKVQGDSPPPEGSEEIARLVKPAGVVMYEAPATNAETGRIRINLTKNCKRISGQTVIATFMGGQIHSVTDWPKVEYNPTSRTKLICNGETNAAQAIIGTVVKHVYGFTDSTLKVKKQPNTPLYWIPPPSLDRVMLETFLAVRAIEARFIVELKALDGETTLCPVGVAMVLTSAVSIDPPNGGTEVVLPMAPPPKAG